MYAHCAQHTVKLHIVENTPSWQLYVRGTKRLFPLQVKLRPKCGRMEIGKRIRRRGLLPKEITLRAPGVQILQRPDSGISSVPTENQLGLRGHFPRSSLIASTMRKLRLRCTKKRFGVMGHRQRAGLWIAVCMRHETVIGFHIMPGAEGKRDFLFPMYKYKEAPPEQVWVDFGCGCSEMALNYCPEYFKDVEFYVDAFHNYSHKCPGCFESKRFPEFEQLNTSLMEQINSFMQPLRGILKSGTTKVKKRKFGFFFRSDVVISDDDSDVLDRSFCARVECSKDGTMTSCLSKLGGRKRGLARGWAICTQHSINCFYCVCHPPTRSVDTGIGAHPITVWAQ